MDRAVTYWETGSEDPRYNLAFEEYLLNSRTEGDHLLLWQNERAVVVGRNHNAEGEIDRAFVEAHGISVVRRITGGGAVYHDLGNLNYSFLTDAADGERQTMERFVLPVVSALRKLGLEAEASGRNDILVSGKKVSGTAQRLCHDRILHHGTLLFDTDLDLAAGALRADPEKFRSKGIASVRSRIGNIRPFLGEEMDLPAFWAYLKKELAGDGAVEGQLCPAEREQIEELKRSRYDTWAWTFGASPRYDVFGRRRWNGGSLEFRGAVARGLLTEAAFCGDFLSRCPLDELTEALRGCPFRRADVAAVLAQYPLKDCFGGITEDEILETIFHSST